MLWLSSTDYLGMVPKIYSAPGELAAPMVLRSAPRSPVLTDAYLGGDLDRPVQALREPGKDPGQSGAIIRITNCGGIGAP